MRKINYEKGTMELQKRWSNYGKEKSKKEENTKSTKNKNSA